MTTGHHSLDAWACGENHDDAPSILFSHRLLIIEGRLGPWHNYQMVTVNRQLEGSDWGRNRISQVSVLCRRRQFLVIRCFSGVR